MRDSYQEHVIHATTFTENGFNGREVEDKLSHSATGLLTVEGQRKDLNTIFLKLRITDSKGSIIFLLKSKIFRLYHH